MAFSFTPAVEPGSLILVTGANGFIGSHIVLACLQHGYRVRGVVRDVGKLGKLKEQWEREFPGKFEVAVVQDLEKEGGFDEAMKGVSAVAHVAAVAGRFPFTPSEASRIVKNITLSCLRSAARAGMVTRFVWTSSVTAACRPLPNTEREVGQETWNDEAWGLAEEGGEGAAFFAYMASKAEGEKAAWEFVEKEKPGFELYTVLPDMNVGKLLEPDIQGSSGAMLLSLWNRTPDDFVKGINGIAYIAVTDTALLHLASLVLPSSDLPPQRLYGCAGSVNVNQYLALFRKIDPSREVLPDFEGKDGKDLSRYDMAGAEKALRMVKGKGEGEEAWKSLEEAVRDCVLAQ
ncbi:hypothetical protein JCM8547_003177 [Rhodosporidiobolus lusitaniae]